MPYKYIFRACIKDEIGGWIVTEEFRTDDEMQGRADLMAAMVEYEGEKVLLEKFQFNARLMVYSRIKQTEVTVSLPADISLNNY